MSIRANITKSSMEYHSIIKDWIKFYIHVRVLRWVKTTLEKIFKFEKINSSVFCLKNNSFYVKKFNSSIFFLSFKKDFLSTFTISIYFIYECQLNIIYQSWKRQKMLFHFHFLFHSDFYTKYILHKWIFWKRTKTFFVCGIFNMPNIF